jgi:hypothetical protein
MICSNSDILLLSSKGSKKHFKLDPKFPRLLFLSGFIDTMYFLQSLLEDYSKRGLSEPTDRAVALSGLGTRISTALDCKEIYGVFGLYLHRNLLWRRSDLQKMMKPIEYKTPKVPSWSWMAYEGGIQFLDIRFGGLDLFDNLRFAPGRNALITNVWEFCGCYLNEAASETTPRQILDSCGTERGWIIYDVEDGTDLRLERSIVVGRTYQSDKCHYHILTVRRQAGNEYERTGIGMVQEGYISRQQPNICVL